MASTGEEEVWRDRAHVNVDAREAHRELMGEAGDRRSRIRTGGDPGEWCEGAY